MEPQKFNIPLKSLPIPPQPSPIVVKPRVQSGIKLVPALQAICIGLALRFLVPIPLGITEQGWSLLSIFVSTVLGLVLDPLPVGAVAILSATTCLVTHTLGFEQAFGALTNQVIWLIVVSFFFAKGIEKTGLGSRIATHCVRLMGKSTLGLALGLSLAETVLSPAMPSTSARSAGIFIPIIKSLSETAGSYPGEGSNSRTKIGAFLAQSQFQSTVHSSCFFITGSADNLLCFDLAKEMGVDITPLHWTTGCALPALLGLILTPLLVFKMVPPDVTDTPEAPRQAEEKLKMLGPMSDDEKIMLATMGVAVSLWVLGPSVGVLPVEAALMGLCLLLVTGVMSWSDVLSHSPAWDTLIWFAVLISISSQLNTLGVIGSLSTGISGGLAALHLGWPALFVLLHLTFFCAHYLFASKAAHVGALYAAFLSMMLAGGVPPILSAMTLAYSVNLFGSITHYSSGQAAAYYGSGYMSLREVFTVGAVNGFGSLALYGLCGVFVWKWLGWY